MRIKKNQNDNDDDEDDDNDDDDYNNFAGCVLYQHFFHHDPYLLISNKAML